VEISACKITFVRPGRRWMDRTYRFDLTVEDLKMQTGLVWLGIGSREGENEYHCMLDTNQ